MFSRKFHQAKNLKKIAIRFLISYVLAENAIELKNLKTHELTN